MDIITKNDIQNLENAPINLMTKDNAQKQLNVLDNEKKEKYKKLWKTISRKALDLSLKDPWGEFKIENEKTQKCIRYMYNAVHKVWKKDEVYVKKQDKSFARGGMRECFRVKKMDKLSNHTNWKLAMNYVCKRYIQDVDRNVLFEDVKLQMDSKLWAEEFNRHNPPKKIDIFRVSILEFIDEMESPLYHLEHFIEGEYIKHNSNSGFVSDAVRMTPHAFSHFTFERSGHQLIIVDIQGVDDLYTDPQIHTVSGTEYGSGNLGTKGMALFFYSHQCNDICKFMKLTEFDLSKNEITSRYQQNCSYPSNPSTKFSTKAQQSLDTCQPIVTFKENAMERLRSRTISINSIASNESLDETCIDIDSSISESSNIVEDNENIISVSALRRRRYYSGHSDTRSSQSERFQNAIRKFSTPAGFLLSNNFSDSVLNSLKNSNSLFVLGQVHLDLARYYSIGRFSYKKKIINKTKSWESNVRNELYDENIKYDKESAIFHLDIARKCGVLEAIKTIAEIAYDLPHDLLKDINSSDLKKFSVIDFDDKIAFGLQMMELAAEMSDRDAIHFIASSYETGQNLPVNKQADWSKAMYWYEKAFEYYTIEEYGNDDYKGTKQDLTFVCPQYEILAKMGQMSNEGGFGLERNSLEAYNFYSEAAEIATEAMKGKLANKYYELAEMCNCSR
ncbi:Eukaryotic elongation factor 2 kinase [Strongyloides ratti]|uniref:Eukaryotic elongation factor 2 kinase n=1 Tax=Strongyloides ratti TaxID=34506 RepID=A0A090LQ20_STRRB|nr:Eukaryotic elongation factor 2 kinase [Strongyloides ratti]CEF70239.1 Eukaryotic elongation factor 2 kinase [Strongyloides ratti]